MVSFGDRYPRKGGTFLKADDLRGRSDLIVKIERVDLDVEVKGMKTLDIVRFADSEYALVLTHSTGSVIASLLGDEIEDWPGHSIALFCDDSVEYEGRKGGVRVRPYLPTSGDGSKPVAAKKTAERPPFDDEISF